MKDRRPSPKRAKDECALDARAAHNPRAERAHDIARRLDRLMRWAQASLLKLARAILEIAGQIDTRLGAPPENTKLRRAAERALAPQIAKLEKFILVLIMLKAGLRAAPPRKARRFGPQRVRHTARRLFGARLRKSVRAKDLRAKIAALLALTHDPEAEIAHAARRLAHGFTRWQGGVPRLAFMAQALCCAAVSPSAANTS